MERQRSLFDDILNVIIQCGGGTIDRLTQQVIASGVIPAEHYAKARFRYAKTLTTQVMKQKNAEGVQMFIITPRREGQAHVWIQWDLAGLEDWKYKLARDIDAIEDDIEALKPAHDFILEKFGEDLALPTLGLLPNQDRWWVEMLDKYDTLDDEDEFTQDPPEDDDC